MPDITYENVHPLISDMKVAGRTARFVFRCPASGATVQAAHTIPQDTSASSQFASRATRSLGYEVKRNVSMMLRRAFGYGFAGRMAGDMASAVVNSAPVGSTGGPAALNDKEQRAAAVEAFRSVSAQFMWDDKHARWISAHAAEELMSPFERQLAAAPVSNAYDRSIMARMLVEIAGADGHIAEEERGFLMEFLDSDLGDVESLSSRPQLTSAELDETSRGAPRDTMLMLAWVLAISDEDFDAAEQERLDQFADSLGVRGSRKNEVRKMAQGYILDQALDRIFSWGGHDEHGRKELMALADRIGMERRDAAGAEARFQTRRGA